MSGVAMIGRLLKPNSFRRRMVLVVVAVVLATGLNLAIQRRRLRTWVLALQQRGMTPYIVAGASNIDPAVSITNRIRVALSGWKCLLVIDNQEQAEALLNAGDSPLQLELKIKPGVPADATQRLREKYPAAEIEENSLTPMKNRPRGMLPPSN